MVCPHCGENNPDKAKYCVRCSATLPRKQGAGGARSGGIDAKTVIIIVLVVALVIGAIFFVRSLVKDKSDDTVAETTEVVEEEVEETEEEEEVEEEETEEEEEEAEHSDWFGDHDLELSDAADDFSFNTMKNDGESDTEEMEVSAKITMSESTENVADGYKIVTAVFVYDISDSNGDRGMIADGAFDRYTGTCFGFEEEQPEQDDDTKSEYEGFVMITDGSIKYDIAVKTDIEVNAPIVTKTINIVCPSDYDGTIFYSGYNSLELDSERAEVNMGEKLHTFDELPFMDDDKELFYFTYEKPDSTGKSFWGTYDATTTSSSESSSEPSRPAK